ncbi:MAG: type II secretion system F family protein [Proteobacteria bacterium]|nr:type II secretion system F family protein [Pseudomonadota bacterium]
MPPSITIFIIAIIFTAVLAASQGMYWAYVARRERDARELARRLGSMGEGEGPSLFREQARDAAANALGGLGSHLQDSLRKADLSYGVSTLLAQCGGAALIVTIVGAFFVGLPAFMLGIIAGILPYALVRKAGSDRTRALLEQLPDTLDLMARSLQAGLGLADALKLVAEEMPLPVAAEFGRVFEEVRFGRDYREAFTKLLDRNPGMFDLQLLVSSILLQRETGGNLIEILDNIQETIRGRFLFKAKVAALTSEAKFSALVLGSLPFGVATMISITQPQYLAPLFSGDPMGTFLVIFAIMMYSFGLFMMNRVSQVEV